MKRNLILGLDHYPAQAIPIWIHMFSHLALGFSQILITQFYLLSGQIKIALTAYHVQW